MLQKVGWRCGRGSNGAQSWKFCNPLACNTKTLLGSTAKKPWGPVLCVIVYPELPHQLNSVFSATFVMETKAIIQNSHDHTWAPPRHHHHHHHHPFTMAVLMFRLAFKGHLNLSSCFAFCKCQPWHHATSPFWQKSPNINKTQQIIFKFLILVVKTPMAYHLIFCIGVLWRGGVV